MVDLPSDLTSVDTTVLQQLLVDIDAFRCSEGRGRSPEARHVSDWCKRARRQVKTALRRKLPTG